MVALQSVYDSEELHPLWDNANSLERRLGLEPGSNDVLVEGPEVDAEPQASTRLWLDDHGMDPGRRGIHFANDALLQERIQLFL